MDEDYFFESFLFFCPHPLFPVIFPARYPFYFFSVRCTTCFHYLLRNTLSIWYYEDFLNEYLSARCMEGHRVAFVFVSWAENHSGL